MDGKMMGSQVMLFSLLAIVCASVWSCQKGGSSSAVKSVNGSSIHLETPSTQCIECHQEVHADWAKSHHANANMLFDPEDWAEVFGKRHYIPRPDHVAESYTKDGKAILKTIGISGEQEEFSPEMVLAYDPMVQFLMPVAGGRWQVTELAWDINEKEWFSVYADEAEPRQPNEWGHWTRRGMNWNAQCGVCHTTHYSKNYDPETDSYQSFWREQGISCMQCHGEMPNHLADPEAEITEDEKFDAETQYQACYSCHSRREDITGNFRMGDSYHDHHRIQLPVNERFYFPDGQIKDEVFVYGSFIQSEMYLKDVRCMDCHDSHSLELKLPVENNELCMVCHRDPGVNGAIVIDPVAHGHHAEGSEGNRCVECHMPERTYMARDPRRDHGFHSPDPILTKELGVPNACMNCHQEEGLDWVTTAFEEWYGESDNRAQDRHKARTVNAAYHGDASMVDNLMELAVTEESPFWRGGYLQLILTLEWSQRTFEFVQPFLKDDSPMVRGAVVQSLSNYPGLEDTIRPMLKDEARVVRLDAAWYLRGELDLESREWKELLHYMRYTSDQPGGALRFAEYHAGLGNVEEADAWMEKVTKWDPSSAEAWVTRGMVMNRLGKPGDALRHFQKAYDMRPDDVSPLYYRALIQAEQGNASAAMQTLETVVRQEPNFDRAWYNLGLLYSQMGDLEGAVSRLDQAISVAPDNPDYPYAKATILMRQQKILETMELVDQILEKFPNYAPARQLKQAIDRQIIHRPESGE